MKKEENILALRAQFQLSGGKITHIAVVPSSKEGIQITLAGETTGDKEVVSLIEKWVAAYVQRKPCAIELPLACPSLPVFSLSVLKGLQQIPLGEKISYGQLAVEMGCPQGARAIGNACGRNPFLLVVPCHRVIGAQGNLGGFTAGISIKKQLLAHEGIVITPPPYAKLLVNTRIFCE